MIFEVFSRRAAATAVMLWMQQNHSFIGSEHTSQGMRSTQKTTKNRFQSLAHAALCPKALLATLGGTIAALWGRICELLGRSWVTFGRPWRPKSWFWDALGRLSSASWTLLGVSWLHLRPYGRLQASFCRVSGASRPRFRRVHGAFGLDFGMFVATCALADMPLACDACAPPWSPPKSGPLLITSFPVGSSPQAFIAELCVTWVTTLLALRCVLLLMLR